MDSCKKTTFILLFVLVVTLPRANAQEIKSAISSTRLPPPETASVEKGAFPAASGSSLADKIKAESIYYALIICNEQYLDPSLPDLDNPKKDGNNLYDILTANYLFHKENIVFLEDANRGDIIDALDRLAQKISWHDNLLIFYAGHGTWDKDADIGYWLPSDARSDSKINWFRNSTLVDYLKEIKSKHTLLITDACFGGSIFKSRGFRENKAISMLYELPSRKAMTSGNLTAVPDRSAFAFYLIKYLSDNKETYLSSEQLFSSFRIAVINNSNAIPLYGDIQNVGDEGGDFIFIRQE